MFQRIRDLREDRDLTQKQVATVLNCSQQVYSNYELGQRDLPTAVLPKPDGEARRHLRLLQPEDFCLLYTSPSPRDS